VVVGKWLAGGSRGVGCLAGSSKVGELVCCLRVLVLYILGDRAWESVSFRQPKQTARGRNAGHAPFATEL
jgi:hypothetical protein